MTEDAPFRFKRGQGTTLLIICGALGREIVDLLEANRWTHLDVAALPAAIDRAYENSRPMVALIGRRVEP